MIAKNIPSRLASLCTFTQKPCAQLSLVALSLFSFSPSLHATSITPLSQEPEIWQSSEAAKIYTSSHAADYLSSNLLVSIGLFIWLLLIWLTTQKQKNLRKLLLKLRCFFFHSEDVEYLWISRDM